MPLFNTPLQPVTLLDPTKKELHSMKHGVIDRSAVGMLLYVCSNTRPDLHFAVHQVCRFAHSPKKSHGQAVKRIICSLVKTREQRAGIGAQLGGRTGLLCGC